MKFTTHAGEIVEGDRLAVALEAVANGWEQLAKDIWLEDAYASHVTEEEKREDFQRMMRDAEKIRSGKVENFTIWQRVNQELTGECVALFSK